MKCSRMFSSLGEQLHAQGIAVTDEGMEANRLVMRFEALCGFVASWKLMEAYNVEPPPRKEKGDAAAKVDGADLFFQSRSGFRHF